GFRPGDRCRPVFAGKPGATGRPRPVPDLHLHDLGALQPPWQLPRHVPASLSRASASYTTQEFGICLDQKGAFNMKTSARALGLVMLVLSVGPCGGRAHSPQSPQANADEKPGSSAKTSGRSEQPSKPATPATMDEVLQAIDLLQLPKLAGAKVQIAK